MDWLERQRRFIGVTTGLALMIGACSGGDTRQPLPTRSPTTQASSTQGPGTTVAAAAVPAPDATAAGLDDGRRPVILDYSPTVSDLGALAFLASHPGLRLVGVTLPGTGESHCGPGIAHTRGVLEDLGLPDVPVACGPEDPITGWNAFPTAWRVLSDEMTLPEAAPNESRTAPELMADLSRQESAPIEIVAVGPLTNLAVALQDDPALADRLAGITIMGGAVDVMGNVLRNEVAEWNIWVDPTAAGIVFASGAPVTLVPLDATNDLPTSAVFYSALEDGAATSGAGLVLDVWRVRPDWYVNADGFFYFWDELAAAVLVDESLVELETARLVVDDDQRENKGWTRRDDTGSEIRVATSADRLGFETLFLETVTGGPVSLGYLDATAPEIEYFTALARINAEGSAAIDELLERTAVEMGLREFSSEESFLAVLSNALPEAFDVVLAGQASALALLDPPPRLSQGHDLLVAAWDGLLMERDDLVAEFAEGLDFAVFDPAFGPPDEACRALQSEVGLRLLDIDLACPE